MAIIEMKMGAYSTCSTIPMYGQLDGRGGFRAALMRIPLALLIVGLGKIPPMRNHFVLPLVLAGTSTLAGCLVIGGTKNITVTQLGERGATMTRVSAVATWTLTDTQNEPFNVVIASDGSAVDNWWKGPDGAKGERGRWEFVGETIDIRYSSGWRDVISPAQLGFHQVSYAPGLAPGSGPTQSPNHEGQAVKVVGDRLPFVGVWTISGALATPKHEVFVSMRSDGMCRKSVGENDFGTWHVEGANAIIDWADGWHTTLEPTADGSMFSKSWQPGVAQREMPTSATTAQRVEK